VTKNRNHDTDRLATARVLGLAGEAQALALDTRPNWLGHRAKTADLDKAMVLGATMDELSEIRGAIRNHLDHLRLEHGLTISEVGNVLRITA
jgi:hypothetical protein